MPALIFFVAVLCLMGFSVRDIYNRLVKLRRRYKNAYSQIDVQLQRRHDLIPNLVNTAKGYMDHERNTLREVMAARSGAVQAREQASQDPGDPQAINNVAAAEATLTGTLGRLLVVSEAYPELKADAAMAKLTEDLRSTENCIAFARQGFNDAVTKYNIKTETFPSNIIANMFNFREAPLLEVDDREAIKVAPKVSF